VNAHDIFKQRGQDNPEWLTDTPIVSLGVVYSVVDATTVRVKERVRKSKSDVLYTVRLVSFASSLSQEYVAPKKGDLICLIFFRRSSPGMLAPPEDENDTIYDEDCDSYNQFSGVGILLKVFDNMEAISSQVIEDGSLVVKKTQVRAMLLSMFSEAVSLVFDSQKETASSTPEDKEVSVKMGRHSPVSLRHLSSMEVNHGIDEDIEGNKVDDIPAPVTHKHGSASDVTIESESGFDVTFKKDSSVEVDGEVTVHTTGPLTITADGLLKLSSTAGVTLETGDAATWLCNVVANCPFGFPHGGAAAGINKLTGA